MNLKHVNTYQMLSIVDEIANVTPNISFLDIVTKAYIAKEYTDLDFSEYVQDGNVDLIAIYDQVIDIWDSIVKVVGLTKIVNVEKLAMARYKELNSMENKLIDFVEKMYEFSALKNQVGVEHENDNK